MDLNEDLASRLRRAVARIEELRDNPATGPYERARLAGKVEGVKLAASYLEEHERIFAASSGVSAAI